jgi:beta-xylosidase
MTSRLLFLLALLLPAAAPAQEGPAFVPVFEEDFADPFVVEHNGEYLAYSTNRGANLPMARSKDLVAWSRVRTPGGEMHDAMPKLGAWAREGLTWAPEVMKVGPKWLVYYTARDKRKDLQCLGVAAAADPLGPFVDSSPEPIVCQSDLGGTIDANPFRDADGKLYLYYKNDGNARGKPTHIWGQRLSADGMRVEGEPVALLKNDAKWEAHAIEAPTMVRRSGGYTMLFSANHFGWEKDQRLSAYAMGYAVCKGPLGPCSDAAENPILYSYNDKKAGCLSGPGHQAFFMGGGKPYLAFHAWAATRGCRKLDAWRYLYVAPVGFTAAGKPVVSPSLRPAGKKK